MSHSLFWSISHRWWRAIPTVKWIKYDFRCSLLNGANKPTLDEWIVAKPNWYDRYLKDIFIVVYNVIRSHACLPFVGPFAFSMQNDLIRLSLFEFGSSSLGTAFANRLKTNPGNVDELEHAVINWHFNFRFNISFEDSVVITHHRAPCFIRVTHTHIVWKTDGTNSNGIHLLRPATMLPWPMTLLPPAVNCCRYTSWLAWDLVKSIHWRYLRHRHLIG